ncbi:MAG: class I SAM-dependent methyltransferase family protein [Hadesarchaea archaeon]|nr:MAG: class I SAM-dependent methyltransferase family protein [Hadesarchaea archaeon]TDA36484.1 MAG: class I SAM-dependent methyltransferase family protein [Hadesarchaea archaeon]
MGSLREELREILTEEELAKLRAFDLVGDIGILRLPPELLPKKREIGEALLRVHRHLKTVLLQVSPVRGEFRTRRLEVIAGEPKTETVHRESGCIFKVDLDKVYFSPRLAYERMRIAKQVREGEEVTNLFAGVGCYSIVIAKHSGARRIYSIDKNPEAFKLMCENIRMNRVGEKVLPFLGDAKEVVSSHLRRRADRVLMPLPEGARGFLDTALEALKEEGGIVHFYDMGEEPDPFSPSLKFLEEEAGKRGWELEVLDKRRIRSYGVRLYHVVLDLLLRPKR